MGFEVLHNHLLGESLEDCVEHTDIFKCKFNLLNDRGLVIECVRYALFT